MFGSEPAIRDYGARVVVMLRGELDIANAADLGAVLSEAVARNPHVIADLSDLTFIDCASLGVLVRARTRAREAGGDLVLAGARGRLRRLLRPQRNRGQPGEHRCQQHSWRANAPRYALHLARRMSRSWNASTGGFPFLISLTCLRSGPILAEASPASRRSSSRGTSAERVRLPR